MNFSNNPSKKVYLYILTTKGIEQKNKTYSFIFKN